MNVALPAGTAAAWVLEANQPPDRFYAGGDRIAAFRDVGHAQPRTPEDWVGSVTTLFGEESLGLSMLPDGTLLSASVAADPIGWLGADHVGAYGADPGLLVKLLDAGQWLPVHAHPDATFTERHLGLSHGKTEAWVFLEAADVALGFSRDVAEDELARWVSAQDVDAMLAAMHRIRAAAGDAILVPAGTPHAIGEGALLVELQEPTDLSILMEWRGFEIDGRKESHLGLGFDTALAAIERRALSLAEVEGLRSATSRTVGELLPAAAQLFRAERLRGAGRWDAGYSVVVCTAGGASMVSDTGQRLTLRRGTTVITAHACGAWEVEAGSGFEAIRCRPPAP